MAMANCPAKASNAGSTSAFNRPASPLCMSSTPTTLLAIISGTAISPRVLGNNGFARNVGFWPGCTPINGTSIERQTMATSHQLPAYLSRTCFQHQIRLVGIGQINLHIVQLEFFQDQITGILQHRVQSTNL